MHPEIKYNTRMDNNDMEIAKKPGVPGLFLVTNFLGIQEEVDLLAAIEKEPWKSNRSGTRRVQMYGPRHDAHYHVKKGAAVTPLPAYCGNLMQKVKEVCKRHFPELAVDSNPKLGYDSFTELFVNEYLPDQSLQFHKDHCSTYEEVILGISLSAGIYLSFQLRGKEVSVFVPRRSLYLMTGDSRLKWKHGIHANSLVDGDRRVSLTLRTVNYK